MNEILPCPFCGGEAKRHDIEAREEIDNAGASYIECEGCGACTQLHFDRKENLVDSWNQRTSDGLGRRVVSMASVHPTLVVDVQAHRDAAYKNGWDDGYAEGFGKAASATTSPAPVAVEAWQDISTAPKDGAPVLLYFPKRYQGNGGVSWGCFIEGDWLDSRAMRDNDASHWQPLPAPPEVQS